MKLILHIGGGKTGSTSIQRSLTDEVELLKSHRMFYAGQYFENCPGYVSNGQLPHSRFYIEYANKTDTLVEHVEAHLDRLMPKCQKEGIDTIIWSNEAMFTSYDKLAPLYRSLAERYDVEVVAYIRRQDDWLFSAYQQWGIKHKTYAGNIKPFAEWVGDWKSECDYHEVFSQWADIFGADAIKVRVFGACGDVVQDFYKTIGMNDAEPALVEKDNVSLQNTHASLFQLYNTHFKGQKGPHDFIGFMARTGIDKLQLDKIDATLGYPTTEELATTAFEFKESNQALKELLGDESLEVSDGSWRKINSEISRDGLVSALLFALVRCERRICDMEQKLKETQGHA